MKLIAVFVLAKPFISRGLLFMVGLLEIKIGAYFQVSLKIKGWSVFS